MIKCSKCGRENDDSFTFCLDCGNPLKPGASEDAKDTAPTPQAAPKTEPAPAPAPAPTPAPAPAAPAPAPEPAPEPKAAPAEPKPAAPPAEPKPAAQADAAACPKCGTALQSDDAFCSSCGHRVGEEVAKRTQFMHVASPDVAQKPKARLILVKPDGTEGTVFNLAAEKTTIGRTHGIIMFPKDPYISPRHADLVFKEGELSITDLDSLNGIYYRMTGEVQIFPGTYFRIGRQLLRLEVPGDFQQMNVEAPQGDDSTFWGSPPPQVWARLVQVLEGGKIGEIHLLTQPELAIGREEGEVRFPEDGFISSKHCMLVNKGGDCYLRDLDSSNGTYLRIRKNHTLKSDDRVQIGNQVLKVNIS
jgi:pSer/pThr/pTyr-binding forkhead associated (FHA) protein